MTFTTDIRIYFIHFVYTASSNIISRSSHYSNIPLSKDTRVQTRLLVLRMAAYLYALRATPSAHRQAAN